MFLVPIKNAKLLSAPSVQQPILHNQRALRFVDFDSEKGEEPLDEYEDQEE